MQILPRPNLPTEACVSGWSMVTTYADSELTSWVITKVMTGGTPQHKVIQTLNFANSDNLQRRLWWKRYLSMLFLYLEKLFLRYKSLETLTLCTSAHSEE